MQSGHFLSEKQKQIKQEIMEKVINGIFKTIQAESDYFKDHQSLLDVLFSILVMTNREVLSRIIYGSNSQLHTKRILKDFFSEVDSQVRKQLSDIKQKHH